MPGSVVHVAISQFWAFLTARAARSLDYLSIYHATPGTGQHIAPRAGGNLSIFIRLQHYVILRVLCGKHYNILMLFVRFQCFLLAMLAC